MSGRIVVMGVSGAGKTTLARALAAALGWRFVEGDALHPPANVAKMAAGVPLTDADRLPFLQAVAAALEPGFVVASCSALRRSYRDLIRARAGKVRFVLPLLDRAGLEDRMRHRTGHFMPATLLDSQLAALEMPGPDENAILVDGSAHAQTQVTQVIAAIGTDGSAAA